MGGNMWRKIAGGARGMPVILLAAAAAALLLLFAGEGGGETNSLTPLEIRVSQTLSRVEGAGKVQVLIGDGEEGGVVVVAQGAENMEVALNLTQAVSAFLGVDTGRVQVLKMQEDGT